jgi:hypothetical protein
MKEEQFRAITDTLTIEPAFLNADKSVKREVICWVCEESVDADGPDANNFIHEHMNCEPMDEFDEHFDEDWEVIDNVF